MDADKARHGVVRRFYLCCEEDGPRVLKEDEEVARLVGGREQRDEVGHAEQRDDDEERLGRLEVLVVLRRGVVGPQLATHHLRGNDQRAFFLEAVDSFHHQTTRRVPNGQFHFLDLESPLLEGHLPRAH